MSTLQIPDGFTKRRGHSNTVSGERPPSLDIEATRPLAVRRNSEGSPGLAPPISISEPSPLPDGTRPILFDEANTSDESVLQNKSSPPSPEPDYLKPETRIKKKSRSRASSVTSSIFSDIRGSAHNQKVSLMGKIKSRHSGDLSDVEVNSIEAPSSIAPSVTPSTVSAKRNQEFHALFRSVPEEDGLVTDYGCALQKEILLQGRIYISQNYLCFNANIFGWVTNVSISCVF